MTVKEILKQSTIENQVLKLPDIKLERKQYLDVKKSLDLIGGKWKGGKVQGFIFPEDPTKLVKEIIKDNQPNLKKEYQFFSTPDHVAHILMSFADITNIKTISILEPSAGQGAIVDAIYRVYPAVKVYAYEAMDVNRKILKTKYKDKNFKLLGNDFLECKKKFDLIIANPPFTKNQDINHIKHMYICLNDGGRIISIASNHWRESNNKKETQFKKWLDDLDSKVAAELNNEEFKSSGTLTSSCVLVIDKKGCV